MTDQTHTEEPTGEPTAATPVVATYLFITGAPGSGKSSVAAEVANRLGAPMFEFGWIPEFRNTGTRIISYVEDEDLAFENLVMVVKNYAARGFVNIIVTDLDDERTADLGVLFAGTDYRIVTLRVDDDAVLAARVLDESRSSGYRDAGAAVTINSNLMLRAAYDREVFLDVGRLTIVDLADQVVALASPTG